MLKIIPVTCFFTVLISFQAFPQNYAGNSDSLEKLLGVSPSSQKAAILNLLAQEFARKDPEKALKYAEEALKFSQSLNDRKEEGISLYSKGLISFYLNNYDQALELFEQSAKIAENEHDEKTHAMNLSMIGYYYELKSNYNDALKYYTHALEIRKKISNQLGTGKSLDNIGNIYQYLGEYTRSLDYYNEAYEIFSSISDQQGMADVLNNKGIIYYYLAHYEKAIELFLQSYRLKEKLHDARGMANSTNNIASMYQLLGDLPNALIYYEKTLEIQKDHGFMLPIAVTSGNLGTVYAEMKQYDKALEYYKSAFQNYTALENRRGIATTLSNMGNVYAIKGDDKESLYYYLEALKYQEEIDDKQETAVTLRRIGELYISLKKYVKAKYYIIKGRQIAQQIDFKNEVAEASFSLSRLFYLTGDADSAYQVLLMAQALQDSIFNKEKQIQITELQTRFETYEKDNEIKLLKQQGEIQKLEYQRQKDFVYLSVLLILFLSISGTLLFLYYRSRQKQKQALLEVANKDIAQRLLLMQMNPHFLYNALGSVKNTIHNNDAQKASDMVSRFARLMRANLENCRKRNITLMEEINSLRDYLDIEQTRLKSAFEYEINMDPDLETGAVFLPPMLIQPLLENSILHGIRHLNGKGRIKVGFYRKGDFLNCVIEDNGVGRKRASEIESKPEGAGKSYGTSLIKERIELLNLNSDIQSRFSIEDVTDHKGEVAGTRVKLEVPFDCEI